MTRNTDPRSTNEKQKMANHFAEMEADYRDADWGEIVYEDGQVVVMADHKGHEFSEWSEEIEDFSEKMHSLADQLVDRSWSADYPVVFDKLEDHDYQN